MTRVEVADLRVMRQNRLVLDIPTLRFGAGRTTAILGPNGAGKTTLLRAIAGLEPAAAGRIRLDPVPDAPRHAVAFVFQQDVMLRRTVRENLDFGLRLRGVPAAMRAARAEAAAALLGITGLLARRADRLSGGEGRRVSLARALCLETPVMLLDEPLAGLDDRAYGHLVRELAAILADRRATTILVTHDPDEALRLADDLVILADGRVLAAGTKTAVWGAPGTARVAAVLGHAVLPHETGLIAVPPGGLHTGEGACTFTLRVERVVDLVDHRAVAGYVAAAPVEVPLPLDVPVPASGTAIAVHARRWSAVAP